MKRARILAIVAVLVVVGAALALFGAYMGWH